VRHLGNDYPRPPGRTCAAQSQAKPLDVQQ